MYDKTTIMGYVGRDPEMRYTPNGDAVVNFSVACDRSFKPKDGGEKVEKTIWYQVSFWRGAAETINQYIHKGSAIYIEGTLDHDEYGNPLMWETNEGEKRTSFKLTGRMFKFLPKGNGGGGGSHTPPHSADAPDVDDIPF